MASRHAEFLAAHDSTQNGREAMASRRAEFIATRDLTTMWEEFEDAKVEWAVEQEAAKAAQRERKSQKALRKREARRRKIEKDARAAAERSVEIQARYSHGCRLTMARDRLRLLAHVYDSVASIHMTENPGRHG